MVHLRPVNAENMWEIADLRVRRDQEAFVTSSRDGLVEAWGFQASGGDVAPFGVYDGDVPVGFVLITHGKNPGDNDPGIADGNYEINHLLIDKRFQGKGFGRAALRLAVEYIKTFPFGPAEYCWLGYKPWNKTAEALYFSEGFTLNGMVNYDENVAVLKL